MCIAGPCVCKTFPHTTPLAQESRLLEEEEQDRRDIMKAVQQPTDNRTRQRSGVSDSSSCDRSHDGPITVSFGIGTTGSSEHSSEPDHEAVHDESFMNELQEMQREFYHYDNSDVQMVPADMPGFSGRMHSDTNASLMSNDSTICFVAAGQPNNGRGDPESSGPPKSGSLGANSKIAPTNDGTIRSIRSPIKAHKHTAHVLGPSTSGQGMLPHINPHTQHYATPDLDAELVNLNKRVLTEDLPPIPVCMRENDSFALSSGGFMIQKLEPEDEVIYRKQPKVLHGYLFGDMLGEGSYGKVKECLNSRTLVRYAVKILKLNRLKKIPGGFNNVEREIRILSRLSHPNVVNLHEVFRIEEKKKWYLVLDYCVGSMQEMLDHAPNKRLPIYQAHEYFEQVIDGIDYLHSSGVIHKDIKPGNLLLALDQTLKITDFGVAEEVERYSADDTCTCGQGTPKFQPPEIASGNSDQFSGRPVDIWAAGVTLYNFVSGEYPFDGAAILPLYQNIANSDLVMPKSVNVDEHLEDMLRGLMIKNPLQRITIDQIRRHPWYMRKHPKLLLDRVPIPCRHDCEVRKMTVYPYLEMLYGSQEDLSMGTVEPSVEMHHQGSRPSQSTITQDGLPVPVGMHASASAADRVMTASDVQYQSGRSSHLKPDDRLKTSSAGALSGRRKKDDKSCTVM